jgi:hypothetical protein
MGYRKVYLTQEEEEDIDRVKATREKEGRLGAAYNAILKEGLAMVVGKELGRTAQGDEQLPLEANVSTVSARRRRRRGA